MWSAVAYLENNVAIFLKLNLYNIHDSVIFFWTFTQEKQKKMCPQRVIYI